MLRLCLWHRSDSLARTCSRPEQAYNTLPPCGLPRRRLSTDAPQPQPPWPPTLPNRVQSYLSTSHDPRVNLSIEHHLLTSSPPDSTVLFLYTNRPSIVIGRNQNPWLEANLPLLKQQWHRHPQGHNGHVDLVRRRSGGGTVYHDLGNLNWTVISPPAGFTRDKHAEMVVRALRSCGVDRARVNERHDIVLDQGGWKSGVDAADSHVTPYTAREDERVDRPAALKVSGSAYKLTRRRALHHGTLLLASADLEGIGRFLKSPAKPYISARGVESVSSPVGRIDLSLETAIAVIKQSFSRLYRGDDGAEVETMMINEDQALEVPFVQQSVDEMRTLAWTYAQTPQFSFAFPVDYSGTIVPDGSERAVMHPSVTVRHGRLIEFQFTRLSRHSKGDSKAEVVLKNASNGYSLWNQRDWSRVLDSIGLAEDAGPLKDFPEQLDRFIPLMNDH